MQLREILERVRSGGIDLAEAERMVRLNALVAVETSLTLDTGREARTGAPEVVLGEGKTPDDVVAAANALLRARGLAIVTRCPADASFETLDAEEERHADGRVVVLRTPGTPARSSGGRVAVVTGGAADAPVAEEAAAVARALGCDVFEARDVGVAQLARAVNAVRGLTERDPHAWVVVAGREGALAPVVAGLVPGPVIGVPVSSGYGHAGAGEAALSTMLQSCSPLLTVNIDAGFVAGAAAAQIANRVAAAGGPSSGEAAGASEGEAVESGFYFA